MISVGIDYSMTCPAACLIDTEQERPRFWFAHESKATTDADVHFSPITPGSVIVRAEQNAHNLLSWLRLRAPNLTHAAIEDYAFSATGRVFHIGEHTGILKYVLYLASITCVPYAPSAIKKFATGKGNADKQKMATAFLNAHPLSRLWIPQFFPRTKGPAPAKSPLSDLADAYWIAKYHANNALTN